jgi:glucokinase
MQELFALSLDLGGTNLKASAYSSVRGILVHQSVPSLVHQGPALVLRRMAELALRVRALSGLPRKAFRGLGVGSPGPLDPVRGVVLQTPNLRGWRNVPVAATLRRLTGLPTLLENDARAAAWGEFRRGAGRGASSLALFTLGTGVGGGLILNGRLLRGPDGTAGELGFLYGDPAGPRANMGLPGSLEAMASARALARMARHALRRRRRGPLWRLCGGKAAAVDAALAHRALRAGDPSARQAWRSAGTALGRAVAGLINALNVERVVLGGGVMQGGGRELLAIVRATARAGSFPQPFRRCRIVAAELGNLAGAVGAAELALERFAAGARSLS